MTHWHRTVAGLVWLLFFTAVRAQEVHVPDPLFQSDEIIDVRIVAPVSTLLTKRPVDEELPGTFQYTNSAGESVELDIQLRTRGRFRRDKDNCRFPPLRLNFKASQTKGTVFHKQDKVKLVTHCQNSVRYAEALLREYVTYRLLNVMTDASFRVRLLRITYVNNEREMASDVHFGFIIEHKERLAKRLGKTVLKVARTSSRSLDPEYASTVAMFHYLIGNTDFSPVQGVTGEDCCHNHVLFGNEGESIWSVPYDFDQAGLVDAPHASPNPRFKLRDVRQRLYRGRCIHNDYVAATAADFRDKRIEILQVVNRLQVARKQTIKSMTRYIETFYKTLASERRIKSTLIKKCI